MAKGKTSKARIVLYIVGPAVIGVAVLLVVLFVLIAGGAVDATQTKLVFSSASNEFIYDGTAHTDDTWTLVDGQLREGHEAVVVVSGSRTDVGTVENSFSVTIKDGNGADVTDYYEIEYQPGTLTVEAADLFIASAGAEKVYDGTPLTSEEYSVTSGTLALGHRIEATFGSSITDAGTALNEFAVKVLDENGEDKTYNYDLILTSGVLTVTRRPITLLSASANKEYDGKALTADGYELTEGSLLEGHSLSVSVTGSRTDAGESGNTFTASVLGEDGADIGSNYSVTLQEGTLTVTPRRVSLRSLSLEKVYDGTPLSCAEWVIDSQTGLVEGHIVDFIAMPAQITNVGSCENTVTDIVVVDEASGADVTANYLFTYTFGTLTVTPRPLTVESASDEKIYDGKALTADGYELTAGSLLEEHSLSVNVTGSRTEAGRSDNVFTVSILAGDGTDMTFNYDVVREYGTLTVQQRVLTLRSDDAEREYNAEPLTADGYTIAKGSLADGQTAEVTVTGSRTDAGEEQNVFTAVIRGADGSDVTSNYAVVLEYGTLTVTPRYLALGTYSAEKYYDGDPLFNNGEWFFASETSLLEGHSVQTVVMPAQITNAGQCENAVTEFVIIDESNRNVTKNYEIGEFWGTLTVFPRPITIRSGSAVDVYPCDPLTNGSWDYTSFRLPLGTHTVEVMITGVRTEIGESPNTIADVMITVTETGEDVTFNYDITLDEGTLIIKGDGTGSGSGGDGGSDGESGSGGDLDGSGDISGGGGSGEASLALRLYAEQDQKVYMRLKSFGGYTGQSWAAAQEYGAVLDGTYSLNYTTGAALASAGYESVFVSLEVLGADYYIPYYPAMGADDGYRVQTSDVLYSSGTGIRGNLYSLYSYFYDAVSDGAFTADLGAYADDEEAYRSFVYGAYLDLNGMSADLQRHFTEQIAANGLDTGNIWQTIAKAAKYIQGAAKYNLDYDTALDQEADIVYAFLTEYGEGVCQHYASAATLLFRMLGIPARYTIGYVGNASAGEWVEVTTDNAHAWVEVYVDGIGWVNVEVTGGGPGFGGGGGSEEGGEGGEGGEEGGEGEPSGADYTVKPINEYMEYAPGRSLTPSGRLQGLSDLLARGYTYEATVTGEQSLPGIGKSTIESFTLYDPDKNDVTAQFDIAFEQGNLQVYLEEITVFTGSMSRAYDGTPLTNGNCSYSGTLLAGHAVTTLQTTGSITNVGNTVNTYDIVITDEETGEDVTYMYWVHSSYGTLSVTPCEIVITADSAEAVYTGEPLTADGYSVSGDLNGHTPEIVVEGSQTNVGYSDNIVTSVVIRDENGVNVTGNYSITLVSGTLRVLPPVQ